MSLAGGLEVSEVMLSELENSFTFGAEYYAKHYIATSRAVENLARAETLGRMSLLITDGDHGSPEYVAEGIPYLLSETVQEGYIDTSKIRYITLAKHATLSKSAIHPGDVLVTKTGVYFGKSAVMPDNIPEANTSSHVAKIELKEGYNPFFVSAFLNSRYGYHQLRRRGIKATRPEIALLEFDDILIPKMSDEFDALIEKVTRQATDSRTQYTALYIAAQDLLASAIGTPPADSRNTTTQSLSAVFSSGRLDAEYFMPKYDDISEQLSNSPSIADTCYIHNTNYTPERGRQYRYIELADVGTYGSITGATIADGQDLPTRARRLVRTGQVIVSSIEGSLQSCALITDEYDGSLCSTGFYVIDSDAYNPETLLLLFKSELVQALLKRGCSGTILCAISEDELRKVRLPRVDLETQNTIAHNIQLSSSLRRRSEHLINSAVKAVEIAIESSEQSAINFIKEETK